MRQGTLIVVGLLVIAGMFLVTSCSTVEPDAPDTGDSVQLSRVTAEPAKPPFVNALAYSLPEMEQIEIRTYQYGTYGQKPLLMDLFYPIDEGNASGYPVVVFVNGFRTSSFDYGNERASQSWGRLVAVDGMLGVHYDSERPDDLSALMISLKENAEELEIDTERIGLWSCSSTVPTALWYAMQEDEQDVKFLVSYYGVMLAPDNYQRELHNALCRGWGCYGDQLGDVDRIRTDLPLFIVRAGRDDPRLNNFIDHFMDLISGTEVQATYVDHQDGVHGFDSKENEDERSQEIIRMTLEFMKSNFGIE